MEQKRGDIYTYKNKSNSSTKNQQKLDRSRHRPMVGFRA